MTHVGVTLKDLKDVFNIYLALAKLDSSCHIIGDYCKLYQAVAKVYIVPCVTLDRAIFKQ